MSSLSLGRSILRAFHVRPLQDAWRRRPSVGYVSPVWWGHFRHHPIYVVGWIPRPRVENGFKGIQRPFPPDRKPPTKPALFRKRGRPTSETQGTCYRGGMEGMGRDPLPRTWDAGREAPGSLPGRGARRTTPQPIVGNCRQVDQTVSSREFQWSKGNKSKPRQEREGSVYRSGSLADTGGFIANCSGNLSCLLR